MPGCIFDCHATGIWLVEARNAAKQPTVHKTASAAACGTASATKNYLLQNVSSTDAKKPRVMPPDEARKELEKQGLRDVWVRFPAAAAHCGPGVARHMGRVTPETQRCI